MPKVMIVDDEEMIRVMIKKSLIRVGYDVIEAENGTEAWDLIQEHHIDLIIVDLVMPKKGGLELLIEMKTLYPDMKKIAISGKLPTENISISGLAERFDVNAVFPKPFEMFDLLKVVKSLVPVAE